MSNKEKGTVNHKMYVKFQTFVPISLRENVYPLSSTCCTFVLLSEQQPAKIHKHACKFPGIVCKHSWHVSPLICRRGYK